MRLGGRSYVLAEKLLSVRSNKEHDEEISCGDQSLALGQRRDNLPLVLLPSFVFVRHLY